MSTKVETENKEGRVELDQIERFSEGTGGVKTVQKENRDGDIKVKEIQNFGDLILIEYARSDHKESRVISGMEEEYDRNFLDKSTSLRFPLMDCTNITSFEEREEEGDKKKKTKGQ